jgi:hypothetical protein
MASSRSQSAFWDGVTLTRSGYSAPHKVADAAVSPVIAAKLKWQQMGLSPATTGASVMGVTVRRTETGKGGSSRWQVSSGLSCGLRARAGPSLALHRLENAVEVFQGGVIEEDLAFAVAICNGDAHAQRPLQFLLGFFDVWVHYADLFGLFRG